MTYNDVEGDDMFTLWLCLFVLLLGFEIITINLVSIWFALGSLSAALVSLLTDSVTVQIGVFVLVSVVVLLIMKPLINKFSKPQIIPTNLDRVIGKVGIITEDSGPLKVGEVLVDGKKWSAISAKKIKKDCHVKILSIDGVKLKVEEIKEEN